MGLNFEARAADRDKQTDALAKKWAAEPKRNGIMIIFSAVKLKDLFETERDYPWRKPEGCPASAAVANLKKAHDMMQHARGI